MDPKEIARRIEELENQAAFQDELHSGLNEIVARQDREILELKRRLNVQAQRLQELRDSSAAATDPAGEIPPHY